MRGGVSVSSQPFFGSFHTTCTAHPGVADVQMHEIKGKGLSSMASPTHQVTRG
jgi:hypothetical protein